MEKKEKLENAEEGVKIRYAVVTGSNKGIGFETVRQLASKGVKVVLTARDEKKGLETVQKLKDFGLSDLVLFHQLDVGNPANIASLADFINTRFGRLDILVNNAGIVGAIVDLSELNIFFQVQERPSTEPKKPIQTYESVKACVETNYYGAKKTAEALIPLLQLSDSPRIVNVSSSAAKFVDIPNELVRGVFTDPKNLTEENVEEVLSEFLKDFKEGSLETKGWGHSSAYVLSKAALNAYTKILAKRYPSFCINCVCPGFVKTDINWNTGKVPIEEGAAHPVRLALLPKGGPSGLFFVQQELSPFLF
ncbi:short-chain dehydrogenase/reductase 1-like [Castanea sativa]|uniref:short-chain dehydrogenase/reductase 1-like n=1 Tax=Castanea sativa TaxID=21020 RepID=UPI003F64DC2B